LVIAFRYLATEWVGKGSCLMSILTRVGIGARIYASIALMAVVTLVSLAVGLHELRAYDPTFPKWPAA